MEIIGPELIEDLNWENLALPLSSEIIKNKVTMIFLE